MNDPILGILEAAGYFILAVVVFILRHIVSGASKLQDTLLLALGLTFLFIAIVEVFKLANGDGE